MSLKKQVVFYITLLLLHTFLVQYGSAACSNHDIETVYGGYDYDYEISEFIYAVDTTTFDMIVAGSTTVYTTDKHFIYFLRNSACSVSWHYLIDESVLSGGFEQLAIRSESERAYGIAKSDTDYMLFEIDTDPR